jgi:hypothetical protein
MFDLEKVEYYTQHASGIAFDTCHKIYIMGDDTEVEKMRGYGYETLFTSKDMNAEEMAVQVQSWFNNSCMLRFIEFTNTDPKTGETQFESVISQFEVDEDEEESEG